MELRLQAEDSFVLKVVQLEELLQVRHSVFVIGNAGSGKSQVPARTGPSPEPASWARWRLWRSGVGRGEEWPGQPGPTSRPFSQGLRSVCSFPPWSRHGLLGCPHPLLSPAIGRGHSESRGRWPVFLTLGCEVPSQPRVQLDAPRMDASAVFKDDFRRLATWGAGGAPLKLF